MLGRLNQRPSIKTTPAQCPAAAKGFIKIILCAIQELPSRLAALNQSWFNVGPPSTTLDQRHTEIDSKSRVRRALTFENIESRSPGKARDHVPKRPHCCATVCDAGPTIKQHRSAARISGQCRHQRTITLTQCRPKHGPSSTKMTQHRAGTGPEPPQQTRNVRPTLHQHRPHVSRLPGHAHTGRTNAATR